MPDGHKSTAVPRMVKTTIDLPEDMWTRFTVKVVQEKGGRKKNEVIQDLIRKYLNED